MTNSNPEAKPAVFLDRDGVLNHDSGYVFKPEDLVILPGVPDGLKKLREKGYLLIAITNQSGIARGYFNLLDVDLFHAAMQEQLRNAGARIDHFYLCPHHPKGTANGFNISCDCRKPGVGLIKRACKDFAIDMKRSFLIGDKDSDVECGLNAGLKAIQMADTQYERHERAFAYAKDFLNAVDIILGS